MLPRQGQAKGVHHHQAITTWNVKGIYLRKRRSKLWTLKWQQIHNLLTTECKKKKLSKQPEQEQNHRYGDHMDGYQLGGGRQKMGGKVQGLRSIICRYKISMWM